MKDIFDNPTPFDTRNDVLDENPYARDDRVLLFLFLHKLLGFGLFLGLIDGDTRRLVGVSLTCRHLDEL